MRYKYFEDLEHNYHNTQVCRFFLSVTNQRVIKSNEPKRNYSIEKSPTLEVQRFSDSQEIPLILWNLKVRYRIRMCPRPVPILRQLDSVHTPHTTL
jgi:hypothetical protein